MYILYENGERIILIKTLIPKMHLNMTLLDLCVSAKCKLSPVRSIGDNDFLRVISWACWYYHPLLVLVN